MHYLKGHRDFQIRNCKNIWSGVGNCRSNGNEQGNDQIKMKQGLNFMIQQEVIGLNTMLFAETHYQDDLAFMRNKIWPFFFKKGKCSYTPPSSAAVTQFPPALETSLISAPIQNWHLLFTNFIAPSLAVESSTVLPPTPEFSLQHFNLSLIHETIKHKYSFTVSILEFSLWSAWPRFALQHTCASPRNIYELEARVKVDGNCVGRMWRLPNSLLQSSIDARSTVNYKPMIVNQEY